MSYLPIMINIIGFIIILIINSFNRYDKISKFLIYGFQSVWGIVLFLTCFKPYGLYLPSNYTYLLLLLNIISFTIGFSLVRVHESAINIYTDNSLLRSVKRILTNKVFILYIIIITCYVIHLLSLYINKLALVNNLGELRTDFFYDNFYGEWFTYIDLLFLNPTQIILLSISMYCLFRYRKPIMIPIFLFIFIYSTLGGGRFDYGTIFITFLFFSICLSCINIKKIFSVVLGCLVIFFAFSYITNMRLSGKNESVKESIKEGTDETIKSIVTYSCGAVVAFDHAVNEDYLHKIGGPKYGGITFAGAISFINMISKRIGLPINEPIANLATYKQENIIKIGSNNTHNALYTAVLYPYLDFGWIGVIVIPLLLGWFVRASIKRLYIFKSLWLLILVNYCFILMIYSVFDFRGMYKFSTLFLFIFLYYFGGRKNMIKSKK